MIRDGVYLKKAAIPCFISLHGVYLSRNLDSHANNLCKWQVLCYLKLISIYLDSPVLFNFTGGN